MELEGKIKMIGNTQAITDSFKKKRNSNNNKRTVPSDYHDRVCSRQSRSFE